MQSQYAGLRSEVLRIYSPSTVTDENGEISRVWTLAKTIRGSVRTPRGREILQSGQVAAEIDYLVTVNKGDATGIDPTYYIDYDGIKLQIESILPGGTRQRYVDMACRVRDE